MADQQASAVANDVHIRVMRIGDHNRLLALMTSTPGITVRSADDVEATRRYLERNPGLSQIAECGGRLVGCAMAGHDGRRGYLQHVIVTPRHRRRGLGRELVEPLRGGPARAGYPQDSPGRHEGKRSGDTVLGAPGVVPAGRPGAILVLHVRRQECMTAGMPVRVPPCAGRPHQVEGRVVHGVRHNSGS
jgi:GNAT superfamily N-acetyltransferase